MRVLLCCSYVIYLVPLTISQALQYEDLELNDGSKCQNKDEAGICTQKPKCPTANEQVRNYGYHNLTRCGFDGQVEIVCCPLPQTRVQMSRTKTEKACDEIAKKFSTNVFPQIAGGKAANQGEFPHIAALGFYSLLEDTYKFKCAGTLISDRYILTAAHCFYDPERTELKMARLGVVDVPENVNEISPLDDYIVKKVTTHPKYNYSKNYNDIALVELEKKVEFSENIHPACLYSAGGSHPEKLIIAGWGFVNESSRTTRLQKALVNLIDMRECQPKYTNGYDRVLQESQICAGNNRSDTCRGDSGGPLQKSNSSIPVLVGLTSFGPSGQCEASNVPSVYTNISTYIDWIERTVWT